MPGLEKITQAQLQNALTVPAASLQKSLSSADGSILLAELDALTRRYPSQDVEKSIGEYQRDFEQLALRYSMAKVQRALAELRIKPGQRFFPRPDEVAEEIEAQRQRSMTPSRTEAQKYLQELDGWRKQHAEYMAELEAKA